MGIDEAGSERLAARLAAIASPQRMRILAELHEQPRYVSELARRVEMSRALLYMHLRKLEEAGFVASHLELGDDGKAVNIFESVPFSISINPDAIAAAVNSPNTRKD
ncbi:ArsR/SmtB family transcription factor [Demequina lutea]|uniref:DNA-binding transcriptional ArsR family regulator n=1 Tax=Demequina lutea TaxID=431489 RepID=A0A7Z0CGM1_9MICO|nr:winged helix-turn-helix domain-containing protein [Demequina lutea]NYI40561.1 DNA-binding transcriptional ArsR family regulator [Demequina lutea]